MSKQWTTPLKVQTAPLKLVVPCGAKNRTETNLKNNLSPELNHKVIYKVEAPLEVKSIL